MHQHGCVSERGEKGGQGVMKRWFFVFISAAALAGLPRLAGAQMANDVRSPDGARHYAGNVMDDSNAAPVREKVISRYDISPLFVAGNSEGVGGGLQLDASIFALRGSFAYMPLLAAIGETPEGDAESVELVHSYQVNADLLMFFWAPSDHSRIGVSGGYRYSDVLDHGVAWGLQVEADVGERATLVLSLSAAFFPEGNERALDALGNPNEDVDFVYGPSLMSGLGLGVRLPI